MKKRIEVVAAVILRSNLVLCVQRGSSNLVYISEKWEFPGGKIEYRENHKTALTREIKEELGVDIDVDHLFLTTEHDYPDFRVAMHAYECRLSDFNSEIILNEHLGIKWLAPSDPEFGNLDWAAADIPIVQKLMVRIQNGSR